MSAASSSAKRSRNKRPAAKKGRFLGRLAAWSVAFLIGLHAFWALGLVGLRYIDPPITGVQLQRRLEALIAHRKYQPRQTFEPLDRIAPDLQHAVIAAEDERFYDHSGIDWKQVRKVAEESRESGEISRGASTLTQQLVKNLFFTTHRNPFRKALEYTLAPMADAILGKQRTLELYLNVVEWGPGMFGAEAASRYHFNTSAKQLSRDQAARLAAILPSPRSRKPSRMNQSSASIQARMRQMGW
jgi:monofunctional biosynthetic peptidoglycan transglycosylase